MFTVCASWSPSTPPTPSFFTWTKVKAPVAGLRLKTASALSSSADA